MAKYYVSTGFKHIDGDVVQTEYMRIVIDAKSDIEACRKAWRKYLDLGYVNLKKLDRYTFVSETGFHVNGLTKKHTSEFIVNDVLE